MSDFNEALEYVLGNEGTGYSGPPENDQPTNSGITAAAVAEFRGVPASSITARDIQNLLGGEINAIYKKLYWDALQLGSVTDQAIATCIFDTGVNRGIGVGAKYAQRACNINGSQLVADGRVGFATLSALNQAKRGPFIRVFQSLEAAGYLAILAAHPEDARYENGWMARSRRLLTLIALPVA